MVRPDSTGISRAPAYLGCIVTGRGFLFAYWAFTVCGALSQHASAKEAFCNFPRSLRLPPDDPHNTDDATTAVLARLRFRLFPFRSPLLRESLSISVPPVTEMFHFTGSPPSYEGAWIPPGGLPHSGICGSRVACASPQLFAACYALHRPSVPRHSPYALITLISFSFCFFRLS